MKTLLIIAIIAAFIPCRPFAQTQNTNKFTLTGTVRNDSSQTNPKEAIKGAIITLWGSDDYEIYDTTDAFGKYHFGTTKIHANTSYHLTVESHGYFGAKAKISTLGLDSSKDFVQDFNLVPIPPCEDFLPEVRFEKGKWELTPQNKDSLSGFIRTLLENPKVVIEFRSHVEPGKTQEFRDTLSFKRAESLVDYFVSKGVTAGRLIPYPDSDNAPTTLYRKIECNGFIFPKGTILTADYINQFKDNKEKFDAAVKLCNFIEFRILRQDYDPKKEELYKNNPPIIFKSDGQQK